MTQFSLMLFHDISHQITKLFLEYVLTEDMLRLLENYSFFFVDFHFFSRLFLILKIWKSNLFFSTQSAELPRQLKWARLRALYLQAELDRLDQSGEFTTLGLTQLGAICWDSNAEQTGWALSAALFTVKKWLGILKSCAVN